MEKSLLGNCGLDCEECPVFKATVNNDEELRVSTAREWSALYAERLGKDGLKPKDIDCSGCQSGEGKIFLGCRQCPIRKCGREKKLATCAVCQDYDSCGMLKGFLSVASHAQARENLERIRMNR